MILNNVILKGTTAQRADFTHRRPAPRPSDGVQRNQHPVSAGAEQARAILAISGMVAGGDFQLALRAARDPGALVARMHTRGGV